MKLKFTQNSVIGLKLQKNTVRLTLVAILVTAVPLLLLFLTSHLKSSLNQLNVIGAQTARQLDLEATNIIAYAKLIPTDQKLTRLIESGEVSDKVKVENRLMELSGIGANIQNIIINSTQGVYHSVFLSDQDAQDILSSDWYTALTGENFIRFFYYDDGQLYFCIRLDHISKLSGEMLLLIRPENFSSIMTGSDNVFPQYVWLNNQNSPIVSGRFSDAAFEYLSKCLQGADKNKFFDDYTFYSARGIFLSHRSDVTRWKFVAFIPYYEFLREFVPMCVILLISLIALMALSSYCLRPVIYNIISPIETLSSHMRNFTYGDTAPIEIHTGDEIEDLSHAFNDMAKELNQKIGLLLEEQKKEQILKYGLHISQINPHFIYNTMNTINYLARKKRCDDIVVVNNALICILKDSLRINEHSALDSVACEVNVAKQYVKIQQYSYPETIEITWDVSPELEACQIPKHILQPIVENSIVHGFLNDCFESLHGETPYIRITISPAGSDSLCICVEDNGIGIDMRAYEKIVEESEHFDMANEYNRGKHIGLANIRWRLAYLLKEKQELKISPCSPHGTRVVIFLPRIS
ncbi:MAG: histidine kinase [Lachnospiraceae bacterium]|nr:histidine kinase [Lachnospiraceae bacterium]